MRSVEQRLKELALLGEFGGIHLLERFEVLAFPDDGWGFVKDMIEAFG